jgi:hypothetical protein
MFIGSSGNLVSYSTDGLYWTFDYSDFPIGVVCFSPSLNLAVALPFSPNYPYVYTRSFPRPAMPSPTNQITGAGVGAGTLTNAPSAGNPTFWLRIVVNGVQRFIPCW